MGDLKKLDFQASSKHKLTSRPGSQSFDSKRKEGSRSQFGDNLRNLGVDSVAAHRFADLLLSEPLLALAVLKDESGAGLDLLADGCLCAGNLLSGWVLSDSSVGSLVQ